MIMTRLILATTLVLLVTAPARAQFVVHDPGNLQQAILIAQRTLREYQELVAQYHTIVRMSHGLGTMDGYRMPTIPTASHDIGRWGYARPWLQSLNTGDPTGAAYSQTIRTLERPLGELAQLPPVARRAVENAYATIEITDAVVQSGGHQLGMTRGYSRELQRAIDALQGDVMNGQPGYHEMTAILDKVAAGALIGRRQDMATNQLLSHAVEQLLARGKRMRDTEAATMNMRLGAMRDGRVAGTSLVRGASDDLRTWRQP
jgi:conjugal transfer/entry exclusion protein